MFCSNISIIHGNFRKYKTVSTEPKTNVSAVMEGKLKEKLESMGIGFLCLSQGTAVPILSICKGSQSVTFITFC